MTSHVHSLEESIRQLFATPRVSDSHALVEPTSPISFTTRFEEEDGYWTRERTRECTRDCEKRRELRLINSHFGQTWQKNFKAERDATTARIRAAHAEKQEKKKHARRQPAKPRPVPPDGLTPDALVEFEMIYEKEIESWKKFDAWRESRKREHGFINDPTFVWLGGDVAGRPVDAFTETGLRSKNSPALARFAQATRKRGEIMSGYTKDVLYRSRSKLLALYKPFIQANSTIIQMFRIELDGDFRDRIHLVQCIAQSELPIMPDIVVYDRRPDDVINRPHFWFFLPVGSSVWNKPDDPRYKKGPMKLLTHVMAAIVDCLSKLGADPGGLSNPFHGKNPLSPLWRTLELNTEPNLTLEQWTQRLGIARTDEKASEKRARLAAQIVSGLSSGESNGIFSAARGWALEIMREIHAAGGQRYTDLLRDRKELARVIRAVLNERLSYSDFTTLSVQSQRVLDKVADYAAVNWKPELAPKPLKMRGVLGELEGTPTERMSQGGTGGAARKKELYRERVVAAAIEMKLAGEKITRVALAERAGVARSTATAHYDAALDAVADECVFKGADKKLLSQPRECVSDLSLGETISSADVDEFEPPEYPKWLCPELIEYIEMRGSSWSYCALRLDRLKRSSGLTVATVEDQSTGSADRFVNVAPSDTAI